MITGLAAPCPILRVLTLLSLCGAFAACRDENLELPERDDAGAGSYEMTGDPVTTPEPCEKLADGEACGEDRYCIKQRCVSNTCGDGVQAGTEECDDGNEALGDMCTPSCKAIMPTCGDARLDEGEECDDGNLIADDACATSCTRNVCTNGRVDPGEECDDGNRVDTDGCSNSCTRHLCRNGVIDPGEECDDANTDPNDGCTNACQRIVCGDGMPEQQEECDDGNRIDTDGCSNACTANMCGNGRVDPGEACDAGRKADGQPIPAGSRCSADCSAVQSDEACKKCELEHCTDYQGSGYDLVKYCYEEEPEGSTGIIKNYNQKCADLTACVRENRCDIDWKIPDGIIPCYCGRDVSVDECFSGKRIEGPCVTEYEAATGAPPGDYMTVTNLATDITLPSGQANYLAECHRQYCRKECR